MRDLFSDIRVVDLSRVWAGPAATRYFADYGAEVIKVEHPAAPDEARGFGPLRNGASGYFETVNRGKKSVALDLKDPAGKECLYRLIATADVLVENFCPGVAATLGVDYNSVRSVRPDIVYCSISGYGQNIPERAYDAVIQGECGLASVNGETGGMKNATSVTDAFAAANAAFAVASALFHRARTGEGQKIDVAMVGCAFNLMENLLAETSVTGADPAPCGRFDNAIFPFGFFRTRDGMVSLAAGNDVLWARFCAEFLPSSAGDARFSTNEKRLAARDELVAMIESAFAAHGSADVLARLAAAGIPSGKIASVTEVLREEKWFREGYLRHVDHSALGPCVVPGTGIRFSASSEAGAPYVEAPRLDADGSRYRAEK